ncbi:acyltransferase ChoActase/COT/CPT [Myxozyma melibiosi]|uniref:Acyltransferase ChoActase/COT/CPT n=1 Tax=Myxozyma melibiosi TaxID=54550 RepID=A0ABR1F6N1_9ASCO
MSKTKTQTIARPFSSSRLSLNAAASAPKPDEHVYVEDWSAGKMLRFQESLPKLPVPPLELSAQRYLKSVSHLVPKDQLEKTTEIVKKFISSSGEGPELQKKLVAKASDPKVKNWVYDWWNSAAYMAYRDPVVPYVSYFYGHKDDSRYASPEAKAAAISTAVLSFKTLVDTKQLEPDFMRKKPMCMDSFKWMFNASRVAAPGEDYSVKFSPENPEHQTILVIRKNRLYILPHEVDGKQLTTAELEIQFAKIIKDADAKGPGAAIGALSSANRDDGAVYREHLISAGPNNKALLEKMESSSFVVALDDAAPDSHTERAHQFWHGDGQNRFYDKPCQFIVCDNKVSGFMGEHSMMDGTPTCTLNDYVCDVLVQNKVDHGAPASAARALADPQELEFDVSEQLAADIEASKKAFTEVIGLHELDVNAYQKYGKEQVKKFKVSPDAWVQLSFQLAYYRKYGYVRPTYESATTRQYQLGRTEVCRSCTPEAFAFVNAMEDASVDNAKKIALARAATNAHAAYINSATQGFGCDRHFFGLKNLVDKSKPTPEFFTDPTFGFSSTWIMSTSQLSSEYFNAYGWSQVTDEGYGIAYMINKNSLQFNVVSKKKDSPGMANQIGKALDDMAALFSTELPVKAKL